MRFFHKRRFQVLFLPLFLSLFLLDCGRTAAQTVSLSSLLDEMTDRAALAKFPEPAFTLKQFSSYDRASKSPTEGWFANRDWSHYLREEENNGRKEWVLFDAQGPGVIVRWWLFNTPVAGSIRVYLDGESEPRFSGPITEMVGGNLLAEAPFSQELAMGYDLYLPIPYAKHCKITVDEPTMETLFYYNLNYRTYPAGTKIETLTPEILKAAETKLAETGKKLVVAKNETFPQEWRRHETYSFNFSPKGSQGIEFPKNQSGAIRKISVKVEADDLPQALRSTLIEIKFDGKRTVFCPIGDFFGSGVGVNPYRSWFTTVDQDGTMTAYWVMPYSSDAEISFHALGDQEAKVTLYPLVVSPWSWDERSMYFNATWHQTRNIPTRPVIDWNYISLQGKGVYVGDVLSLVNYHSRWWGEGDEKIFVDGETFPSHFGTGTEDYYGYAWSSNQFFEHPFIGQPRCEGPDHQPMEGDLQCYGNTTNYRFRSLDGIPFHRDFRFDMEILHHTNTTVDYSVATMWYGRPETETTIGLSDDDIIFEAGQKARYDTPGPVERTQKITQQWRQERRIIDLHQHVNYTPEHLTRCIKIMDEVGVDVMVNLSGGFVTHSEGEKSEFERNKELADTLFPGRFVHYFSLDFNGWDEPDWQAKAVAQVEEAFRLGAAGLKEYKRLGLFYKDKNGQLIKIDDPKLDPIWARCGELGMPITIHIADPLAFWAPYDETNERWDELRDHPGWWFGDPEKYPPFHDLLDALHRAIQRHPDTTFVCAHFGCYAEDAEAVAKTLDQYPNMMVDLAARIPELGRQDAKKIHDIFTKYADRILFGTDFMVYDRLILGSSGNEPPPTDEQAVEFYRKHWRWFDTNDRQFEHMTPIQGNWKIDAIGLSPAVQRKILFDNARKLLARSLPTPKAVAHYTNDTITLDGKLHESAWEIATPVFVENALVTGAVVPQISTTVRTLWSDDAIYFAFEAPYTELTVFEPPLEKGEERLGLWDRDVVEVFIGTNLDKITQYTEFEVAPTGEKLDLKLDYPEKDFPWSSGFEAAVHIDSSAKKWTTEVRIPFAALAQDKPASGTCWRINFYRHDIAWKSFLAWNPALKPSAHTPERFGILQFQKSE